MLRAIRPATIPAWRRIPIRGTATYEYRMYGDADGPNYHLIHFLTQEQHKLEVFNDPEASKVEETIKFIHELDYPIRTARDLEGVPIAGEKLTARILRFLGNAKKRDLVSSIDGAGGRNQPKSTAIRELQTVEGIGPIKARALVEQGCMSVQQLRMPQYMKMLSPVVQASLQLLVGNATQQPEEAAKHMMTSLRTREVLPSRHLAPKSRRP